MATIITNQATLNYRYGDELSVTTVSNIASATLNGSLDINKTSLNDGYRFDEVLTYVINLNNTGAAISNITVTDDLGTYQFNGNSYTPLTYTGTAQLFVNGVLSGGLTVNTVGNNLVFSIDSLPANSDAQIIYQVRVNGFADIECGSVITNTATTQCNCLCNILSESSNSLVAECYADVRIFKSICPNPIICGEEVSYIIDIYNYGNIDAEDVVLTDTFNPILTDISVYANGVLIPQGEYSYINGVLTFPAPGSDYELIVPAATFTRNMQTGEYMINPGHLQITVSGNI